MPIGGAWNTRHRVIDAFVACRTTPGKRPLVIGTSGDAVNVGIASIRLAREIGHRVAIQTSWIREDRVDFVPLRCRPASDDSHIAGDHAKVIPVEGAGI